MRKNKFIMRNVVAVAICLAGMMMFSGCKKETNNPPQRDKIDGIYLGTLTTTNLTTNSSHISTPTIDLKYGTYSYEGLTSGSCCCGAGNFTTQGDMIFFRKSRPNGPTEHIWCGNELNGDYDYRFEGDSLFFSKIFNFFSTEYKYEFALKKETGR